MRAAATGDERVKLAIEEGDVGYADGVTRGKITLRRGQMINTM